MKNRISFSLLCLMVVLFSSCTSYIPKIRPADADLNCDTCLFMMSKTREGMYELRRIDVAVSNERLSHEPEIPGIFHILRFHPNDAQTKEMWWKLWGGRRVVDSRPSPRDSDFIQLNLNVTRADILKPDDDGAQDIAIGYLDQVPTDTDDPKDPKNPNDTLK